MQDRLHTVWLARWRGVRYARQDWRDLGRDHDHVGLVQLGEGQEASPVLRTLVIVSGCVCVYLLFLAPFGVWRFTQQVVVPGGWRVLSNARWPADTQRILIGDLSPHSV